MAKGSNGVKAERATSLYHVYLITDSETDVLERLGSYQARNAEGAVKMFIEAEGQDGNDEIRAGVAAGTDTVAVIPERNITRVTADVEVKRTVKLRSA